MNRVSLAAMAAGLAFAAAAAQAQTPAPSQGQMGAMTNADANKWTTCQKMTKDAMMKDTECARLSKMHSGMTKTPDGGAMTKDKPKTGM